MEEPMTKFDPWGTCKKEVGEMFFEDSFTAINISSEYSNGKEYVVNDKSYIPLDDSSQYLEGLQKKLARVQGKTKSKRVAEAKEMITNLAMKREDHTSNFLSSDTQGNSFLDDLNETDVKSSALNTIDPQGSLGVMMRKLAPEHVALTEEELYELMKGDTLAKAYEQLQNEDSDSDVTADKIEPEINYIKDENQVQQEGIKIERES